MCPPFHSISKSLRAPSIIPPARTVVEDETRRNTFWYDILLIEIIVMGLMMLLGTGLLTPLRGCTQVVS